MKCLRAVDVLSSRVACVAPEGRPADLVGSAFNAGATHVAVLDNGVVRGIMRVDELLACAPGRIFADLVVRQEVPAVPADAPLEEVERSLRDAGTTCAAVVGDRGEFIGAVTLPEVKLRLTEARADAATITRDSLLTAIEDSVILTVSDLFGTILDVNQAVCRVSGYSREELVGSNHRILNSGTHPPEFWKTMWESIGAGQVWRAEICNRRKDGTLYWVDTTIAPVRDRRGVHTGYISARIDVTDRVKSQAELRSNKATLRRIIETVPECIKIVDADCRIVEMNAFGLRMIGAESLEQVRGRSVLDMILPQYRAQYEADVGAVFRGERVLRSFEIEGLNHERRWAEQHAVGLTSPDRPEQIVRMLAVTRDVTDRVHAEERLRKSQARLVEAQRIGLVGSWELDLASGNLEWSDTVYEIFELDRERFTATYETFLGVIHPNDRERVNETYTRAVRNRTAYDIVHRLLMPDGRIKHVRERCETHYDDAGVPIRSIGTVQDISDLKRAEAIQLAAVRRESLETIVGGIAHEFNSMLLAAAMYLAGVRAAPESAGDRVSRAEALVRQAQSLSAVLLELFSDGGHAETPPVDLRAWLARTIANLADSLPPGIRVVLDEGALPVSARIDPLAVEQILRILLSNASDAMDGQGQIFISARREVESGVAAISVEDSGHGVREDHRDRIFDPFFTTRKRSRRSGLGLAIASRLAEKIGATLVYTPRDPVGSIFTIRTALIGPDGA